MVCGGCQGRRQVVVFRFRSCRSSEVVLPFLKVGGHQSLCSFWSVRGHIMMWYLLLRCRGSSEVILLFGASEVIVCGAYCLGLQKSLVRCVILLGASEIIRNDPSVLGHQRPLDVVLTVWSVRGHQSDVYSFWGRPRSSKLILLFWGVRSHRNSEIILLFWASEVIGIGTYCLARRTSLIKRVLLLGASEVIRGDPSFWGVKGP
jgi:hypothetical protein